MNTFFYVIIFITGCFFGSFFTLAVYRIPRKEDILIKHSYCPNCNHKLGFFDLFPVLSYIFLGGKCRYCGNIIRARYLILELLSGISFLIIAITSKVNVFYMDTIISLVFLLLYISILFIISGIDKENIKVEKSVILFGYIIELIYIIYQYTLGVINVYQYVIYLIFIIILLVLSIISKKNNFKERYYIQNLYLVLYTIIFCGSKIYILTVIFTLFIILIYKMIIKKETKIPIAFCFSISNIIIIVISKLLINYMI